MCVINSRYMELKNPFRSYSYMLSCPFRLVKIQSQAVCSPLLGTKRCCLSSLGRNLVSIMAIIEARILSALCGTPSGRYLIPSAFRIATLSIMIVGSRYLVFRRSFLSTINISFQSYFLHQDFKVLLKA